MKRENQTMKTAEKIIQEIRNLPPEERQKVADYLYAEEEELFRVTKLSPEDMAKLDRDMEEYRQGIDVSPVLKTKEEILSYLNQYK